MLFCIIINGLQQGKPCCWLRYPLWISCL